MSIGGHRRDPGHGRAQQEDQRRSELGIVAEPGVMTAIFDNWQCPAWIIAQLAWVNPLS